MKTRFLPSLTITSTLVIGTLSSQALGNSAKAASITDFCTLNGLSYTCDQEGTFPVLVPPTTNPTNPSDGYVLVTDPVTGVKQQVLQAPSLIHIPVGQLAQLVGISIQWKVNSTETATVTNTGSTSNSFTVTGLGANAALFIPSSQPTTAYAQTGSSLKAAPVTSNLLAPGKSQTFKLPSLSYKYSTPSGPPYFGVRNVTNFEGTGFFTGSNSIYVSANLLPYTIQSSNNGQGAVSVSTKVSGTFSIKYNYTVDTFGANLAVPEPSVNVGISLALGGLGLIRFLKSKQS